MTIRSIFFCLVLVVFFGLHSKGQKYLSLAEHSTTVYLNGINESTGDKLEKNTKALLDIINDAYKQKLNPTFPSNVTSSNLNEIIGDLWAVSPFLSVETEIVQNVLSTSDGQYEVRNIQLVFEEAKEGYEQQDAVIRYSKSGKIVDFKLGLGYHHTRNILSNPVDATDTHNRLMILEFVENFRTAYTLKDLDYLNKVFSEKALIITGRVLKETAVNELQSTVRVEYLKRTKKEYLANLGRIFSKSKMIDVNFDSIKVVVHPKFSYIYGVHLKQKWNSQSISGGGYNDIGYVFLIIDFYKQEEPKIWVRTWDREDYFSFNAFTVRDHRN